MKERDYKAFRIRINIKVNWLIDLEDTLDFAFTVIGISVNASYNYS